MGMVQRPGSPGLDGDFSLDLSRGARLPLAWLTCFIASERGGFDSPAADPHQLLEQSHSRPEALARQQCDPDGSILFLLRVTFLAL